MRRVLLVAAVGVPLVALAITAQDGQVLDTTNFSAKNGNISYVNKAQCDGTDALHLEWKIVPLQGATFGLNDQVIIYASDTNPSTLSGNNGFCTEKATTTPTTINADRIGDLQQVTNLLADKDIVRAGAAINTATKIDCTQAANEDKNVYVCAHWYDQSGQTKKGLAVGTFHIQRLAPNAPADVTLQEGDTRLLVSWTANGAGPPTTDHYVARAFLPGAGTPVRTATVTGTSATITGLVNGQLYEVDVVAVSVGGNESPPSPTPPSPRLQGTPAVTADFWQVYHDRGGVEQGGCSSGAGGALALLGLASLFAFRRRKP